MLRQLTLDALRRMQTGTAGAAYNPNTPIPQPGQPTNTQITPMDLGDGLSPNALAYVNQDINAFNAPQTIPGASGQQLIPATSGGLLGGSQPAGPSGHGQSMQAHIVRAMQGAPQMMTGLYGRQTAQMAGLLGQQGYPSGGGIEVRPGAFRFGAPAGV